MGEMSEFNKIKEAVKQKICKNQMMSTQEKNSLIQRMYTAAVEHPNTTVENLLKKLNISRNKYKKMCELNMSVPQYRSTTLFQSRVMSPETREKQTAALEMARSVKKEKQSQTRPSKKRSKSNQRDGIREYMQSRGHGSTETNSDDVDNMINNIFKK